jgi:hypothetical protein
MSALQRGRWKSLARIAPYMLLGPISGPLAAGAVVNLRGGRPVLGSLYAVALVLFLIDVPLASAWALPLLHADLLTLR